MDQIFKNFLFPKNILVNDTGKEENAFEVVFAFANKLGIKIVKGAEYATLSLFKTASTLLGIGVHPPFYRGFPETVKMLTTEELLYDQLCHYFNTYYLGNFDEEGHSVFEKDFDRIAFHESVTPKRFSILNEEEAAVEIKKLCDELAQSTRPLSYDAEHLIIATLMRYNYLPEQIAAKDTRIDLYLDTGREDCAKKLKLSEVIDAAQRHNWNIYNNEDVYDLHFKNKDRKLISALIDSCFEGGRADVINCYEKQRAWVGLLHHIHYKPKCEEAAKFCKAMREGKNVSAYAEFEAAMAEGDVCRATDVILKRKGQSALLRRLNYILSRAKTEDEVNYVFEKINSKNVILLIQLLQSYAGYKFEKEARTFKFTKFYLLKKYTENENDIERRGTVLDRATVERLKGAIQKQLEGMLKGKLGKVYVDPDMKNVALPIQETTASGGYGTLPKGSRIPLPKTKKIRAFTYWEKVNDIDLSVEAITFDGRQRYFNWMNMYDQQSDAITFSGDQTSGFDGGSEYFDIKVSKFKKEYPNIEYLIFANSVYSEVPFNEIVCTAGYMTRDMKDSGEVFEPKTVKTSFKITAPSTTAYLFAIDLKSNELIWLNIGEDSMRRVAATSDVKYLRDYFDVTEVINYKSFFEMLATEVVDSPKDADVIVSDKARDELEGKEIIKSYDMEKVISLLNS